MKKKIHVTAHARIAKEAKDKDSQRKDKEEDQHVSDELGGSDPDVSKDKKF